MRKHALALLTSMFESESKEVEKGYRGILWLDAQEDEEVLEEKGAPNDMKTQYQVSDPDDLDEITEYEVEVIKEKNLVKRF